MRDAIGNRYDVAITGGGPAGASLAIRLANAGRHVLLVEQKKFPREKLCGEFVSPECLAHLADLGISSSLTTTRGNKIEKTIFYSRTGRSITIPSTWFNGNGQPALGLSRAELDLALMNRAKDAGVNVIEEASVIGLMKKGIYIQGVVLQTKAGSREEFHSTITIDATGRNRALQRFIRKEKRIQASHVAFKTHLRGVEIESDACEIYSYGGGYGGCNFVEGGLANVCFIVQSASARALGSDPERAFRDQLMSNIRAKAALGNSEATKPWLAVPIDRYGRGELCPAPGLLSVGDAAGFIDPFTGSGILLALESSQVAAKAIEQSLKNGHSVAELESDYAQMYSKKIDSRLRLSSMIRSFAYRPFLASVLVTALSLNPTLRRQVARATR